MTHSNDPTRHRHEDPDDRKARIAAAWAELMAAASTDPKARAFLSAFGPAGAAPAGDTETPDGEAVRGDGDGHAGGADSNPDCTMEAPADDAAAP